MKDIKRMTVQQSKRVNALIKQRCCNCDADGHCILLDDDNVCPQCISKSLICKHAMIAVLPGDQELYADIYKTAEKKRCKNCGDSFSATSKNQQYCTTCREKIKRKKAAERQRKHRQKKGSA